MKQYPIDKLTHLLGYYTSLTRKACHVRINGDCHSLAGYTVIIDGYLPLTLPSYTACCNHLQALIDRI